LLVVVTGAVFVYWDTVANYYAKWTRPVAETAGGDLYEYYCPMHPQVVRDEPGTCPICLMPLSKREKGRKEPLPEGALSRVKLSADEVALGGIRLAEVEPRSLTKRIRTMGFVEVDERRLARIAARVPGRIEKVHVDFTGSAVVKDAPLVDIYSPELTVATTELLTAAQSSSNRSGHGGENELVAGARKKLNLLGMSNRQIDDILAAGKTAYTLTILAPQGGVVLKKSIVEGQYVQEGSPLYEIADLTRVWVQARVYEDQLPYVSIGQKVEATGAASLGRSFPGKVAFVDPVVDRQSRTVNVRFDLDNASGDLRPGMYVMVNIDVPLTHIEPFKSHIAKVKRGPKSTDDASLIAYQQVCPVTGNKLGAMGPPAKVVLGKQTVFLCCPLCEPKLRGNPEKYLKKIATQETEGVLAIPAESVIDTGTRKIVYKQTRPGVFEGIEVVLGPQSEGQYPVISGLAAGDRIAAAGAFLIDADTRLNPAQAATYFGATGGPAHGGK
ncbi:MAG TPA: efflux RND transporter periplasmic adaptor subunit, partial [Lacipirellulaceae bacterium]|nr:efflux RND transporter periplasmic adaptor subunit [Lacipirellulaceae bacterium]